MDLRERLLHINLRRQDPPEIHQPMEATQPPLEILVAGEWIASSEGRFLLTERLYPLDHEHGGWRLDALLDVPSEEWAPFASPTGQCFDAARAVFIDTETTGLARGAGTYAFLIGIGFYQGDHFVLRQYFMPDYADEEALLSYVAQDLAGREGIISFNGRCFDWPILEARYILARREPPCGAAAHLDLLPLSRGLWRRTLSSCALSALETQVLGLTRDEIDIPGYLIPQIYQEYLRYGYTRPLARVFYHNAMDVLSMVSLAARAGHGLLCAGQATDHELQDHLALGRLYERRGLAERAIAAYRYAAEHSPQASDRGLALQYLSFLYKRLGRLEDAAAIWRSQLDKDALYPYIELAKQLEHQERSPAQAREVVLAALDWLHAHELHLSRWEREALRHDLDHRLVRLDRRLALEAARSVAGQPTN